MAKEGLKVVSDCHFKIDTHIPPPQLHGRKVYPFGEMEVGHSFALSTAEHAGVASAASWFGQRNGRKYSVRKEDDHYRCWRVA